MQARRALRDRMYGENDLSRLEIFAGGYLNFGYWRDIRIRNRLTTEDRVAAQEAMYRLVLDELDVSDGDRLVEVGCGIGRGAALAAREYPVREINGVDLLATQVERAKTLNADAIAEMPGRLHYVQGEAGDLPLLDRSAQKVFSIEAAQHFEDLAGFSAEAHRVLAHGGRLAATSFFATDDSKADLLTSRLETFADGIDLPHCIDALAQALREADFVDVTATSIGKHVWFGFDRWLEHTSYADSWAREWLRSYRDGAVDYYLVHARKR